MLFVNADNSNILTCVNNPGNCLLLVAFSLTEKDFISDLEEDSEKDYAKLTAKEYRLLPHFLWEQYHLLLVNTIKSVAASVRTYGVTVKLNTELKDLRDLSGFNVVTLIAHFNDEKRQIELSDKLHSIDDFVSSVDNNFDGIFDLSVCNSTILQDKLKEKYGDLFFIKANQGLAEIRTHLIMYKNVIEIINRVDANYLTVLLELRNKLNIYIQNKI